jgi:hypothetical protein
MNDSSPLQFKTHKANMYMIGPTIYCFKYANDRCDLASFTNPEEAREWLITPFPTVVYKTVLDNPGQS